MPCLSGKSRMTNSVFSGRRKEQAVVLGSHQPWSFVTSTLLMWHTRLVCTWRQPTVLASPISFLPLLPQCPSLQSCRALSHFQNQPCSFISPWPLLTIPSPYSAWPGSYSIIAQGPNQNIPPWEDICGLPKKMRSLVPPFLWSTAFCLIQVSFFV